VTLYAEAVYTFNGETKRVTMSSLDLVRVVANASGFDDVDAEPTEDGWKITASRFNATVSKRGRSLTEASVRLIDALTQESQNG
jgi:hypothetical protein